MMMRTMDIAAATTTPTSLLHHHHLHLHLHRPHQLWRWSSPLLRFRSLSRPPLRLPSRPSPRPLSALALADTPTPHESFFHLHQSFFEYQESRRIPSILDAGSLAHSSAVLVVLGSEEFVDRLCMASPAAVEVAHFSLEVLADIKEKHDDARCWHINVADLSEFSGSFDTIFLNYYPIFTSSLTKLLKDVTKLCNPGGTVVISLTQDKKSLLSLGNQSPGILRSSLPDEKDLIKMVSALPLEIASFQDDPGCYLVALKKLKS